MKKDSETIIDRVPKEWLELFRENEHHIRAKEILKDAIQMTLNSPEMTPEVKDIADFFIILLDETGNSFKYDAESVIRPVVKIAKAEGRDKGGKTRAKLDKRTGYLEEIEKEAVSRSENFKRYGYQAAFVAEMLKKYPDLKDGKAIIARLSRLKKTGLIKSLPKKQ